MPYRRVLTINKKKYKVISAIFDEGEEMNRGHYTCMLRTDKKNDVFLMIYKLSRRNDPKE